MARELSVISFVALSLFTVVLTTLIKPPYTGTDLLLVSIGSKVHVCRFNFPYSVTGVSR